MPDRRSLPEPDIAVVEGVAPAEHPTTALLVIEVAVSSLRVDRTVKPDLYAAGGVPEYWVFDVDGRRLEVLRDPKPSGSATHAVHDGAGVLKPAHLDLPPLDLARLFADL